MLTVQDLHKHYGGSHILRGLSFELKPGEITVVMGRNGVGKTTLLKSLMGVVPVTSGSITLAGENIDKLKTHQRVRAGLDYVPQGREIFGRLTVMENLQMGLSSQPAGTPLPDELFQLFPVLDKMRSRRGGDLSGGQQQQLAIARALAPGPKVLLLDEPTEGIQPNVIQDIGRVIKHLAHDKGLCVVLVEQYYDFCEELADQYLLMQRGEIVMRGRGANMKADGVKERLAI
ncbi:urea ABC transporter ATP-binding subunit UrtE [Roseateles asaccharophilus]|uniref:urea ABC transporter ATP-binding subunit UrtE n=1 Tax=Roseateles asaccharophilus TaxID=582607 RepID=UPI00286BAF6C|nr:urea ABC transporter ATP-binding subunit UrtE [Roseateles asaccharophilus]